MQGNIIEEGKVKCEKGSLKLIEDTSKELGCVKKYHRRGKSVRKIMNLKIILNEF